MTFELPRGFTLRRPQTDDLEAVNDLVRACELADEGQAESTADDLLGAWQRSGFDLEGDAWLVIAPDQRAAGYADVWGRDECTVFRADGYVHPSHRGRGMGRALVRLTGQRARERLPLARPGARVVIDNVVTHDNEAARRLLEQEGYRAERFFWRMVIGLAEPPPPPVWPDGVSVRAFQPGHDDRDVYALIQDAFSDNHAHVRALFGDWKLFMLDRETFDPGQYFLAASNGEIIAAVLCPRYEEQGWIRQVAVRRDWRRRGVGAALLRHAFAELRRRYPNAALVVDSYNRTGARDFYESVGMRLDRQYDGYQKVLREARQPASGN